MPNEQTPGFHHSGATGCQLEVILAPSHHALQSVATYTQHGDSVFTSKHCVAGSSLTSQGPVSKETLKKAHS